MHGREHFDEIGDIILTGFRCVGPQACAVLQHFEVQLHTTFGENAAGSWQQPVRPGGSQGGRPKAENLPLPAWPSESLAKMPEFG